NKRYAINWYAQRGFGALVDSAETDFTDSTDHPDTSHWSGVMENEKELVHADITAQIVKAFYDVYNELGVGFLENVYKRAMVVLLKERGLRCELEVPLPIFFHGENIGDYRADLIVEKVVIVEVKTGPAIHAVHITQAYNYLKASRLLVALVMNYGPKAEFKRVYLDRSPRRREVSG
ncbi:MAG: GxxExxY protein, partial [Gemmatimonadaceae bacterium]